MEHRLPIIYFILEINRAPTKLYIMYQLMQPTKLSMFQGFYKNLFFEFIFRNIYKVKAQLASNCRWSEIIFWVEF